MHNLASEDGQCKFVTSVRRIAEMSEWEHWDSDPVIARELISRLYQALLQAGQGIRINRVEGYNEDDLDVKVQHIGDGLDAPNGKFWPNFENVTPEDLFDDAFIAMRMLDDALWLQHTALIQMRVKDFETSTGYYVVPCKKNGNAGGLARRGLKNHRIFPSKYDGIRLSLYIHPDVELPRDDSLHSKRLSTRNVGAAIFPKFKLEEESSDVNKIGNVIYSGVIYKGSMEEVVENHCSSAVVERCDTLVWPELTMPPEQVEQVMALLRENPLRGGGKPPVVVAGSWHVKVGKRTRNRGSVLDGRGDLMFWFDKCLAHIIDRKS